MLPNILTFCYTKQDTLYTQSSCSLSAEPVYGLNILHKKERIISPKSKTMSFQSFELLHFCIVHMYTAIIYKDIVEPK